MKYIWFLYINDWRSKSRQWINWNFAWSHHTHGVYSISMHISILLLQFKWKKVLMLWIQRIVLFNLRSSCIHSIHSILVSTNKYAWSKFSIPNHVWCYSLTYCSSRPRQPIQSIIIRIHVVYSWRMSDTLLLMGIIWIIYDICRVYQCVYLYE